MSKTKETTIQRFVKDEKMIKGIGDGAEKSHNMRLWDTAPEVKQNKYLLRECPDCGRERLRYRQRYCDECSKKRRRKTNRESRRKNYRLHRV